MSDKLDSGEIIRLLDVLIGDVEPIGDQAHDNKVYWNSRFLIDVTNWCLERMYSTAQERHSPYESARSIAENAYAAILEWKDWCVKVEEELT